MGLEELLAGHLLCDRYRVEAVIGRGGMGIVYRATDSRLEREVAVKVITAATGEVSARARMRDRFQREARAIARLQHPNVVGVYDFGTDPRLDLDFLVMELLRGEDLASRLSRVARLPVGLSAEIVVQAAHGLSAGHDVGIVHRDVKPGNLYLRETANGRARVALLDFGIVQIAADAGADDTMTHLTVFGRAPHSPAYAAPEQIRGDPGLTPACDVWALAVTAFQMMAGEKPFSEAELGRVLRGGSCDPPSLRERNSAVPEPIDLVIRKALAVRPADRFGDARAFGDAFEHALNAAGRSMLLHDEELETTSAGGYEDRTLLEPLRSPRPSRIDRWRSPFHAPKPGAESMPGPERLPAPAIAAGPRAVAVSEETSSEQLSPPSPDRASPRTHSSRHGRFRRAASAAWSFIITIGSVGLAATFALAFLTAHDSGAVEPFYASLVGLSLALPWALHRLFGRRGSFALALIGSALAVLVTFRFVEPLTGPDAAVLILPLAQLVISAWILRLTRRHEPETELTRSLSL